MQFSVLRMLASGLFLMDSKYADGYLPLVNEYLKGNLNTQNFEQFKHEPQLWLEDGEVLDSASELPKNSKSVAVAQLNGPIMKEGTMCQDGTADHAAFLESCYAEDSISGVVFEVDSPGGAADAIDVMVDALERRNKPVLFHVNGMMGSAAYWLASYGDEIHSNFPNSVIGSIGAMATIINMDGVLEKEGAKVARLHSKLSPNKNAAAREFLEEGKTSLLQKEIDELAQQFIDAVAKNRGIESNHEVMSGGVYNTETALSFGLIDGNLTLAASIDRCIELSENYEAPILQPKNEKEMFGTGKTKFKALAALAETNAEERTEAQLEAANAELNEAGINAELAEAGLAATLNSKVEELTASVESLETAKAVVEGKLSTEKQAKEAAEQSVKELSELFGEDAEKEEFDLKASVTSLKEEHAKFAKMVPGGAAAIKNQADDMDGGDDPVPSRSASEEKMLKENNLED